MVKDRMLISHPSFHHPAILTMIFLTIISTNDQNEDDDCFVRENETEHLVSQSPKNINDAVQIHPSVPVINDVYDITPFKSNENIIRK